MKQVSIIGTQIDNISIGQTLTQISDIVGRREFRYAVTPNVDHLMRLRKDRPFREIYEAADLVVADGVPLLWASRILGTPLKGRVNGTDLFETTCSMAAERGYSVYLLGGNPGSAIRAAERLKQRHPALKVAGAACPEPGFERDLQRNRALQNEIRNSGADILFVALGSPKQENWIYRYAAGSGVSFAVGIGISFSFVAGDIKRAPVFLQRSGFEWLWRLCAEPRRLWKRYLIDDLPFLALILMERFRRRALMPTASFESHNPQGTHLDH